MKTRILLFFIMFGCFSFAQNDQAFVDSLVAQKMAELEMQTNPEYFFRKDYCEGNIQMFTMPDGSMCTSASTYYSVYIFWREGDDILKLQKFDNCGSYKPFSIQIPKPMSRILKEKEAIKTENVKPYEGEKSDQNAFGNMTVKNCHKEYKFVFGGNAFEKKFREFDLANDSKYENINAEYNNSLQLVALDKEISEAVQNLEKNGKFFREN